MSMPLPDDADGGADLTPGAAPLPGPMPPLACPDGGESHAPASHAPASHAAEPGDPWLDAPYDVSTPPSDDGARGPAAPITTATASATTHRRRGRGPARSGGRRRAVLAVSGAVGAVVAIAAVSAGLFSPDSDEERALPDPTRTPVTVAPDPSPSASTASPSPSVSTGSSTSPSPSASATGSAPAEASPTRPSKSATRPSAPSKRPSRTERPGPPPSTPDDPVEAEDENTLRQGDRGPEVLELQMRLRQAGLYDGRIDGDYDWRVAEAVGRFQQSRGLTDDPWGVYGPATRRALEG
ncbi:peptidoglycan-binding protein [Streptomyces triticagri]|uniref:Peptidoglycan-binding protein n=1 Tax=Streptomyces triticagri TaxID=2293568 RepID=A0A372M6V2_9ACTN|nr:peptidoglycan-binding protein [Streptomyces triticagri]